MSEEDFFDDDDKFGIGSVSTMDMVIKFFFFLIISLISRIIFFFCFYLG
jgi:hypothetical protein